MGRKFGSIPWNKGLKYNEDLKAKLNMSGLEKGRYKGKDMSALKGDNNPMKREDVIKKVHSNPNVQSTYFSKGHIPWTKGKKGLHLSPKTEFTSENMTNEKHHFWKGKDVGYCSLHRWLDRHLGKPLICERCQSTEKVQWASKNYRYTRNREDWLHLCFKCHRKYDSKNGWGIATKKFDL